MSYYYQPDLELSCNNGDFFFFYCINELSYLRRGRKAYGPACTLPSNHLPYSETQSGTMRGKKRHYLILLDEKKKGSDW